MHIEEKLAHGFSDNMKFGNKPLTPLLEFKIFLRSLTLEQKVRITGNVFLTVKHGAAQ